MSDEEADGEALDLPEPPDPRVVGAGDRPAAAEMIMAMREYSGPLPDGEWFREIEALHPGATQIIVRDYTNQRKHERAMERQSLDFDRESFHAFAQFQTHLLRTTGTLAGVITLTGAGLVVAGYSVVGLAVLVAEVGGLVVAFLGRSRSGSRRGRDGSDEPPEG